MFTETNCNILLDYLIHGSDFVLGSFPTHDLVDVNFGFCLLMSVCRLKFPLQVLQQAFHISDMALNEGLKKWDFASMKSSSEAWISGSKTRLGCSKLENDETVFFHIANLKMLLVFDGVSW